MASISQLQAQITDIPVTNPSGIQSVYANNATLLASSNDIRIVFGEIFMDRVNGKPEQQLRANVVMTIAQAQALAHALIGTVENSIKLQADNEAQLKKAEVKKA
jgi:hypothetical protein